MKKKFVCLVLLAVFMFSIFLVQKFLDRPAPSQNNFVVSKVIDGDTFVLSNGKHVRLLGINAPEKNEPYFLESGEQLAKIEGRKVRLDRDVDNKDKYGRLLRYVFLDDHFVNLELVEYGYARAMNVRPNVKFEKDFAEAEKLAKKSCLGLWEIKCV